MRKIRNILIGIIAIAILIGGCFGLIKVAMYAVGYFVRGTRPIPGDATRFDPIAAYPDIVKFAGDNVQLINMIITYVKPDGTLDLTAGYGSKVSYRFTHVLDSAPANSAPLGAGGKPGGTYAEGILINLVKPDTAGSPKDQYYNFGMTRATIPASPLKETIAATPTCSAKQLWDIALKNDAPANAVATITYDSTGYVFAIKDTSVRLQFSVDCTLTQ